MYSLISPDLLLEIINSFSTTSIDKTSISNEEGTVVQGLMIASYVIGPIMIYISHQGKKLRRMVFS